MELLFEVQPRVVVDVLQKALPIIEVSLRQSVKLRKSILAEHNILSVEATLLNKEAITDSLDGINHALILRHLVHRLHDLQQVAPVLHQNHLGAFYQQQLNRRQKRKVAVLLTLSSNDSAKSQWRADYDMGVIEVSEELDLLVALADRYRNAEHVGLIVDSIQTLSIFLW